MGSCASSLISVYILRGSDAGHILSPWRKSSWRRGREEGEGFSMHSPESVLLLDSVIFGLYVVIGLPQISRLEGNKFFGWGGVTADPPSHQLGIVCDPV